jgi:hypothetical protein
MTRRNTDNPTEALRTAINDWKREFERVRWERTT